MSIAFVQRIDGRLLARSLVKIPVKAKPKRTSNGRLKFHQTTYLMYKKRQTNLKQASPFLNTSLTTFLAVDRLSA